MAAGVVGRRQHRMRIEKLVNSPPANPDLNDLRYGAELHAHWAKYTCVLISGFMEHSVKEMFVEHASAAYDERVSRYVELTWPKSKNMRCDAIREIFGYFDKTWESNFDDWLREGERVKEINETVSWRNDIAHGKEANANNVTLRSVGRKFRVACDLVDFVEELLKAEAA